MCEMIDPIHHISNHPASFINALMSLLNMMVSCICTLLSGRFHMHQFLQLLISLRAHQTCPRALTMVLVTSSYLQVSHSILHPFSQFIWVFNSLLYEELKWAESCFLPMNVGCWILITRLLIWCLLAC